MTLCEVNKLSKSYPSFRLDGVSFKVSSGEIVGFIGKNGAGKSTTLKSMLGFVKPDSGGASFFGKPFIGNETEIKQRVGYVAGGVDYYQKSKLGTLIDTTKRFYPNWDAEACRRCLERFELDIRKTPSELSAGMKVKLALTLALSHRAELLILDEPTSGLDPVSRDELLDIFLSLRDEGKGILFSTHIIADLERCADRIIYIRRGRIIADSLLGDFERGWRIVRYSERPDISGLIGERRERDGFSALVRADARLGGLSNEPASLEEIMLHIERGDQDEGSAL